MLPEKIYWPIYITMIVCFLILSLTSMPTFREKTIGVLITMVNILLYYRN